MLFILIIIFGISLIFVLFYLKHKHNTNKKLHLKQRTSDLLKNDKNKLENK